MKPAHSYLLAAAGWVLFIIFVPTISAQEATLPRPTGVPQDWSQRHIVYSRAALAEHPEIMEREPRVLHQEMQRWQAPDGNGFAGVEPHAIARKSPTHRDWNVIMGGRVAPDMFPSKYVFDPSLPPDCTRDYVVFGLASTNTPGGTTPPANLVAFNNLYVDGTGTAFCAGTGGPPWPTQPNTLFAYNITTVAGGRIKTSPVLSLDGTKIAFVESVQTAPVQTIFHVLTWTAGAGTIAAPAVPTSMTNLLVSGTAVDSYASPWVDYDSDTAYVGTDDGKVYQIKPVFGGTPALTGGNWPIQVTNRQLTNPVLDSTLGKLLVGSVNGYLFQIDTALGVLGPNLQVGLTGSPNNPGIYAGPIVDITSGTAFVVSPNGVDKIGVATKSAVLVQVDIATMTEMSEAKIGQGASVTKLKLYEPALDNNYYNGLATGMIHLCGTGPGDTSPYQYAFGFTAGVMNTVFTTRQQLLTSPNARCTGWTEFYNPNKGVAGTDFFFFGLSQDCYPPGNSGVAHGCVEALSSDPTIPTAFAQISSGPTGIIIDNYSTAVAASSLYFTANGKNTAYKFTQDGLR